MKNIKNLFKKQTTYLNFSEYKKIAECIEHLDFTLEKINNEMC